MVRKAALLCGSCFLFAGVAGFVPAATRAAEGVTYLFGVWAIDPVHSIFHLTLGALGLIAASSHTYARWYVQISGIVCGLIFLTGILQGDTILGLFTVNTTGAIGYAVLAVTQLSLGLSVPAYSRLGGMSERDPV